MSNLNLPRMTYATLKGMLNNAALKGVYEVKLAYATTITLQGRNVIVRHHGNPIAEFGEHFFTLSGSGWNSPTTATRLHKILTDNQTPIQPGFDRLYYGVTSRDNKLECGLFITGWNHETKQHLIRDIQYAPAHFARISSDHHYMLVGDYDSTD